jgi:two-component system, cell cycle response regulator CtrA
MRILIVEHDLSATRRLTLLLKSLDAAIDQTDTGEEAIELARHYDYDLVLLALMLPDMDGYEVVRRLRAGRIETPVLVLSGVSRPEASVKALRMGADDFMVKPFDEAELLARVKAVIRRSKGYCQPTLQIGPMALHLDSREVTVGGEPVSLTGKEYNILQLLTLRKGMVLSKEVFLNHLYGGIDEPEPKIIDVFICKLRKKLASAGSENLIRTVWGQGYVLSDPTSGGGHLPVWRIEAASVQQNPLTEAAIA